MVLRGEWCQLTLMCGLIGALVLVIGQSVLTQHAAEASVAAGAPSEIASAAERAQPARVIYVIANADPGGDGGSWATAFAELTAALDAATAGNEIWVAAGTYYPDRPLGPESFELRSGVAVYGGFAGTETSRAARDPAANRTVLSGDLDRDGTFNSANSNNVVIADGVDASTVLDGFTITWGYADFGIRIGGGIKNEGGSPTLTNLIIEQNYAYTGGGLYNSGAAAPTLTNVRFVNNQAYDGGGMLNEGTSAPRLVRVTFEGNSALNGSAVLNRGDSSPSFEQVTFTGNRPAARFGEIVDNSSQGRLRFVDVTIRDNEGDGIATFQGHASFERLTVTGNTGTGISVVQSTAVFTDATVTDNAGAGISTGSGSPIFINATITGNRSSGVSNFNGSPIFVNATISGNEIGGGVAGSGGGVDSVNGRMVIVNSTIADNRASGSGGGVYLLGDESTIVNTRITGNRAQQGGGIEVHNSDPVLTNVLISGNLADISGGGVFETYGSLATFTGVTIAHNKAVTGGGLFSDESNSRYRNVIIWGNDATFSPEVADIESNPAYDHTLIWNRDLRGTGTGNLDGRGTAAFVSPIPARLAPTSEGDYRLLGGTPAINAGGALFFNERRPETPDLNGDGDQNDVMGVDLTGAPRTAGAAPDLGAYEGGAAGQMYKAYLPTVLR